MAYNKECIIFVLDVRRSVDEDFKQKSVKCVADVLKQKICTAKKDYVSFVLVGTEQTNNDVNTNDTHDGYFNIVQYPDVQIPTWQLLINLYKFANEGSGDEGEWLDALVVALRMLKSCQETLKFQRQRIVLFYDFNDGRNSYDSFQEITESILQFEVQLIVVCGDIVYIDNPVDGEPQAVFGNAHKTAQHLENEKYAMKLVSYCNAILCNFHEASNTILKTRNKRPWSWNSTLRIGSKICIAISGIIAAKNESNIKLKKVWTEPDEVLTRDWGYYIDGNRVRPDKEDLIDGYMLGGTPIAYDELEHNDKLRIGPGLTFMGFIKRRSVFDEYFSSQSIYVILHQKGMTASAKKLDALVRVLLKTERAILCWKVYSEKINKPHIVVLLPNEIQPNCPATMSMIELAHHAQYHFFEFPKLRSKHTECSDEQLAAIDNLIDSMDLTMSPKESQAPRNTCRKDLIPFDKLPHIFELNFMNILERKVLCNASEDDEQFLEMLNDKNFVDIYWKLPEEIEQEAKDAAAQVKQLFPLKINTEWLNKVKASEDGDGVSNAKAANQNDQQADEAISLDFDHVRQTSPAEDFEQLLRRHVFTLKDNTRRDVLFGQYASQLRSAVWNLLFNSPELTPDLLDKIRSALSVYRKQCFVFAAIDEYNKWIGDVKAEMMLHKMHRVWQDVVVKGQLGLCFVGETSLEEQIRSNEFYGLECSEMHLSVTPEDVKFDESSIDALLADY